MRKLIAIILCFVSICTYAQINASKADALIKAQIVSQSGYAGCWIFRYNASSNINLLYNETIVVSSNVFVYAVTKNPEQGWLDGYEYYFVNKNNGSISKQTYKYSPKTFDNWTRIYGSDFATNNKTYKLGNSNRGTRVESVNSATFNSQSHKYAVIINGGHNSTYNYLRYWNDCSVIYQILKKHYGYNDADIYVLMSDGKSSSADRNYVSDKLHPKFDSSPLDLDGDGVCDIDYSATKSNITTVFNQLSQKLSPNDYLFVFSTDHGVQGPYLNLWNETRMSDTEFAKELDKVGAGYVSVLMLQCFSGGFIEKLAKNNRVIMTAATGYEYSYADMEHNLENFFIPWFAAMTGVDINGNAVNADLNNDGEISMYEAFVYAEEHDEAAVSGQEHPQYCSLNSDLGTRLTLNGYITSTHKCVPTVYANKTFSSNQTIKKCCVGFKNVVVKNNANVVVDIDNEFLAQDGFEVQLGSEFTVK